MQRFYATLLIGLLAGCGSRDYGMQDRQTLEIFYAHGKSWKIVDNISMNRLAIELKIGRGSQIESKLGPILTTMNYPFASADFDKTALQWLAIRGHRDCQISRDPDVAATELAMSFVYFCKS